MGSRDKIKTIIFSTRLKRILPVLLIFLIPAAIKNNFTKEILLGELIIILIYASASIQNAIKDKDYELPKYTKYWSIILLVASILISTSNRVLFIGTISWIALGYIYNFISRKVTLGDTLIAGLTHFFLPVIISSTLVGLDHRITVPLSIATYFITFTIGPITNLKDIEKDKKAKYKTLVSQIRFPQKIAKILITSSILIFFIIFKMLNIPSTFILLNITTVGLVYIALSKNNLNKALSLTRLHLILFYLSIILYFTTQLEFLINTIIILFLYVLGEVKWKNMM